MNIRNKWIHYNRVTDHFFIPRLPNEDNLNSLKPSVQRVRRYCCHLYYVTLSVLRSLNRRHIVTNISKQ